jgi:molybdate-binding protein
MIIQVKNGEEDVAQFQVINKRGKNNLNYVNKILCKN